MLQNVDSEKTVKVDGQEISHGQELKLKVGAKIDLGGETEYQVTPVKPAHCADLNHKLLPSQPFQTDQWLHASSAIAARQNY